VGKEEGRKRLFLSSAEETFVSQKRMSADDD